VHARRAPGTEWEDYLLAIHATYSLRHPSTAQEYDVFTVLRFYFTVCFPTLQHVLQTRSEMLKTHVSRVTPWQELDGKTDAALYFDPSGSKTYQVFTAWMNGILLTIVHRLESTTNS
jgi:hypothetical protein